jgi:hypothetical protein
MFRIRKHFWLLYTGKWYFSIAFVSKSFVSDSNVRRLTLFYANGGFNTHIHQRKSRTMQQVLQGYIEGYRRHFEHCV